MNASVEECNHVLGVSSSTSSASKLTVKVSEREVEMSTSFA